MGRNPFSKQAVSRYVHRKPGKIEEFVITYFDPILQKPGYHYITGTYKQARLSFLNTCLARMERVELLRKSEFHPKIDEIEEELKLQFSGSFKPNRTEYVD